MWLVPRIATEGDEEDEEDPRDALVRRLLEHQKFKAAAELLHERETVRSAQWTRPDGRVEDIAGKPFERELEVDLFSLLQAFQSVLTRARERPPLGLPEARVSVDARIEQLLDLLSDSEACGFEDLFAGYESRPDLITTFLALLEMIRLKLLRVSQRGLFGPIRVYKREPPTEAARPMGDAHRG